MTRRIPVVRLHLLPLVLLAVLASTPAWGGLDLGWEVTVDTTNRDASGTLGSVRNSSDSVQYIGCSMYTYDTGSTINVVCVAKDESGTLASCSTSASNFVEVATTLGSESHVLFSWDTSGECTYLFVSDYSYLEPKQD